MKNPRFLIFSLILPFVLVNCKQQKEGIPRNLKDSVVVIFMNPPDQKWFYHNSGCYSGRYNHATLKFIGEGGLFQNFDPRKEGDTLSIPCFGQDNIIVSHLYKGMETHEFLIKRGDTVVVRYDVTNFPLLESKVFPTYSYYYNLNYNVKNRTVNHGLEPQTILNDMHFGMVYLVKTKNKALPLSYQKAMQERLVDYINLDSIIDLHQKYVESYGRLLDSLELSRNTDSVYIKFHREKLGKIKEMGKVKEWLSNPNFKKSITNTEKSSGYTLNDKLAYNFQYQNQLGGYLYVQTTKEGVKNYTTSNSKFSDYRTVFDIIAADESVPPLSKTVLLAYCFDEICMNFKVDDKLAYYSKFLKVTRDTVKAKILKERNKIDLKNTSDLLLIDSHGKTLTLNEAISLHRGKVIYLDFWAPWCSPCREEMANSVKLHEYYNGKELVFMNVVVFDTKNSWEKIKTKFEKNPQIHYYFATNSQSSKQLESLGVNLIPHFMIFNKNGDLVVANAKRPKDRSVYVELDAFI